MKVLLWYSLVQPPSKVTQRENGIYKKNEK